MYDTISNFLRDLGNDRPVLWSLFVLAVVSALSLSLYQLWEVILRMLSRARPGKSDPS